MKTLLTTTALVLSAVSAMASDFTPETRVADSDTITGYNVGFDAIYDVMDGSFALPTSIADELVQLDVLWNTSTEGSMTVGIKTEGSSDQASNGTVSVTPASVRQSPVGDGNFVYDQPAIDATIASIATSLRVEFYGSDVDFVEWNDADSGFGLGRIGSSLSDVKGIYNSIDEFADILATNFSTYVWTSFNNKVDELEPAVTKYNDLQTLAYNQLTAFDGLEGGNAGNE